MLSKKYVNLAKGTIKKGLHTFASTASSINNQITKTLKERDSSQENCFRFAYLSI